LIFSPLPKRTSLASIVSALSKPVANSIDLTRLAGLLALALSLAVSIGCWEEIKYEPAPEAVQPAAEEGVPPLETTENSGAETVAGSTEPPAAEPGPVTEHATDAVAEPTTPPLDSPPLELSPAPSREVTAPADAPAATPAQRRLIWQAAGKWSLAAAMFAKQLPAERLESTLKEANDAATELGLSLPPLPTPAAEQTPEQATIATLSGEPAASLVAATAERFGKAAGALADLAIRTNLLLLTYSPRRDDVASEAARLRTIAEDSGLPGDAWTPLADLLQEGAEFVPVRSAIFDLHRRVENLLAETSR
jgi:hypothetical protein